ncbi:MULTISPECIES: GspH/FimT family pseudopilin [Thermus]|uniref:Prepilin-type cleavage/methylation domain-containing protein n=1 Tax=Thermus tengchongensis TaxID=1214928 RepID=A0ABY2KA44_9DEIN|nr:GspH/FimT family pseudopilin [Thermus tengchongensis]TFU18181.1 prepilin-type cleavage/methylation domain-containing protein [Thermus tengchongensis]
MRQGFSLLEFMILLGVLGLLLGLGIPNYLRWRAQAQLDEAARSLAWTLQQARAEAKRTNSPRCVKVFQNGWASGTQCATLNAPSTTLTGMTISTNYTGAPPLTVEFQPPYGTTDAPLKKFTLTHQRAQLQRSVHVVGVIGRVVVR